MSSVFPLTWGRYLLCRLPEVSRMRQSAVKLGQLLQHVGQLGERWPVSVVKRPAGREDLLWSEIWSVTDESGGGVCRSHPSELTVTSLPRLISAKTFLIPCPLPTCQMVASTGWLVIGQSLAWSSYQIVLKKKKKKKSSNGYSRLKVNLNPSVPSTYPKAYTSAAVEKGRRSSLLPGLIFCTISGAK